LAHVSVGDRRNRHDPDIHIDVVRAAARDQADDPDLAVTYGAECGAPKAPSAEAVV